MIIGDYRPIGPFPMKRDLQKIENRSTIVVLPNTHIHGEPFTTFHGPRAALRSTDRLPDGSRSGYRRRIVHAHRVLALRRYKQSGTVLFSTKEPRIQNGPWTLRIRRNLFLSNAYAAIASSPPAAASAPAATTLDALGPFGPCSISNVTVCPTLRLSY